MFEHLRGPFKRCIAPIARGLVRMGVSANAVTIIGAVGTIVVGFAAGITGWLFPGAIALTVLVIFDSLDGSVAAITTGGTKFGAFLDSTLDRIADWAVLVAVILFFILHTGLTHYGDQITSFERTVSWVGMGSALFSIMTSFVTSYARARAESVGYEAKNGVATRSDRLVIILVGMGIAGITHQSIWLAAAMVLLAVLGIITVSQRIDHVRRTMKADEADADDAHVLRNRDNHDGRSGESR
ncbi:MAG: CDP-alcohol phosphatidyltransferase family protein [Bifidobacterium sp.]|nr:CDP-alcohol phosphatidyltransferase family protein [Bifidobacterium sp.]MCI1864543.1 CDP-alcohol phosphatidyltransferase family protein [Bifidobacterium sp.]